ncbi:MAG: PP2C family protein-serine/threonine phosphatase [Phycisphaerales bacterium]
MSAGLLDDFHHEYEAERRAWLRRRFLIYTAIFGGRALISVPLVLLTLGPSMTGVAIFAAVALAVEAAIFIVPFVRTLRGAVHPSRDALVRTASRVITANLLLQFAVSFPIAAALTAYLKTAHAIDQQAQVGPMVPLLLTTFFIHFTAAVMLPLTPRETIRPLLPFLASYAAVTIAAPFIFKKDSPSDMVLVLPVIAAIGLPGLFVAWLRNTAFARSFTNRAVRARYAELSSELNTARRIHDRLFPAPIRDGLLRVEFAYEPMRQIGGDILYARKLRPADSASPIDLVVIDVTGHGIAAALAVNRLHAELNRLYGMHSESPPTPGRIIDDLNEYVSLTMADEGFFATAICVRVDPVAGTIVFANAGHPPAFLLRAEGTVERLDSTTFMLGAGAALGEDFVSVEASSRFGQGDRLVVYTDGATEARSVNGTMLGIDELEIATKRAQTPEEIVSQVRAFRGGPPQDDTLVVAVQLPPA